MYNRNICFANCINDMFPFLECKMEPMSFSYYGNFYNTTYYYPYQNTTIYSSCLALIDNVRSCAVRLYRTQIRPLQ